MKQEKKKTTGKLPRVRTLVEINEDKIENTQTKSKFNWDFQNCSSLKVQT